MKLNLDVTTRTESIWLTVVAVLVGLGVITAMGVTATAANTAVTPLMVIAGAMHVSFLVLGSARWIAASTAPLLGAVVLESGFSDDPSWVRSIVLGCAWFVAMELSWEAIDRRRAVSYTTAASLRRVQEVVFIVGIALAVGLIASSATSLAPVRSVALQTVVLGGLLATFVSLVRHAVRGGTAPLQEPTDPASAPRS